MFVVVHQSWIRITKVRMCMHMCCVRSGLPVRFEVSTCQRTLSKYVPLARGASIVIMFGESALIGKKK